GLRRALGDHPADPRCRQRRRQRDRRPHPPVAERASVVLEVDLEPEWRRAERGREGERPLEPARPDVAQEPFHAAYLSASARFNARPCPARERSGVSTPSFGSGAPSKRSRSTRTWSWKYSRWRARRTA